MTEHAGALSLLPTAAVLILALLTRRTVEALVGGALVGYLLTSGLGFFEAFTRSLLSVMQEETVGWIVLVVALFGGFIALVSRGGGTRAFGDRVAARVRGRRGALLATWAMGVVIFLDDYLNALAVGSSMRPVTDHFGVSREKLAYVVDSTAAPVCILVPLSTWGFYVAGLLEGVGAAPPGGGLAAYVGLVPFFFYAWAAVILVAAVAAGLVPDLGPMRRAEARARHAAGAAQHAGSGAPEAGAPPPRLLDFALPLVTLVGASWMLGDALRGVLVALGVTLALLLGRRTLGFAEVSDTFFEGVREMVYPIAIILTSFALRNVNADLGLTRYVIGSVEPIMSPALLPAVAFVSLSLVAFATGSFWGVYAVSLPIIAPLAESIGASMPLSLGAVVSAGAFGSHACFYGDSSVLSASSSGCDLFAHVTTQLPYALLAAAVASLLYLAGGLLA